MKTKALITMLLLATSFAVAQASSTSQMGMRSNLLPAPTTQAEVREDEIYNRGTTALNDSQWQKALEAFTEVSKLRGRRADGALYWKAYAENKMGNRGAAAGTIADLRKSFPKSTWLKDASALEVEMNQASGRPARPEAEEDEDVKLLAINSLMNTDEERAIPLLQKVLDSPNRSERIKERALFVLSQSDSPKAQQVLHNVARGQAHPELQIKAIHNLGISGNTKELSNIYTGTTNDRVKREILHSLGIAGDTQQLLVIARSEKDPEVKDGAIHGLAIAGGETELRQLYKESTDAATKTRVLKSAVITGDMELVNQVLKTETDPNLRREAIHILGINGGEGSSQTLVNMYGSERNKEVKNAALEALFISGDAHALVSLARKETDPEMRKKIVEKLSVMGDKEANDYLMELLNK
jgi:HEAT repeat protein